MKQRTEVNLVDMTSIEKQEYIQDCNTIKGKGKNGALENIKIKHLENCALFTKLNFLFFYFYCGTPMT